MSNERSGAQRLAELDPEPLSTRKGISVKAKVLRILLAGAASLAALVPEISVAWQTGATAYPYDGPKQPEPYSRQGLSQYGSPPEAGWQYPSGYTFARRQNQTYSGFPVLMFRPLEQEEKGGSGYPEQERWPDGMGSSSRGSASRWLGSQDRPWRGSEGQTGFSGPDAGYQGNGIGHQAGQSPLWHGGGPGPWQYSFRPLEGERDRPAYETRRASQRAPGYARRAGEYADSFRYSQETYREPDYGGTPYLGSEFAPADFRGYQYPEY